MNHTNSQRTMIASKRSRPMRASLVLFAAWSLAVAGCGSGFDEFLRQTAASGSRVFVDILLTDLANVVAEIGEQNNELPPDPIDDDIDEPDDTPPPADLEPDAVAGAAIFGANGCGGCHCPDAVGGCALNAPTLIEIDVDMLDASLVGDGPHVGGKFGLSPQDLVDLEAYLAELGS